MSFMACVTLSLIQGDAVLAKDAVIKGGLAIKPAGGSSKTAAAGIYENTTFANVEVRIAPGVMWV